MNLNSWLDVKTLDNQHFKCHAAVNLHPTINALSAVQRWRYASWLDVKTPSNHYLTFSVHCTTVGPSCTLGRSRGGHRTHQPQRVLIITTACPPTAGHHPAACHPIHGHRPAACPPMRGHRPAACNQQSDCWVLHACNLTTPRINGTPTMLISATNSLLWYKKKGGGGGGE